MFGANGVNVFQRGKIGIKNKLKNSWDTFFMGVHFVIHGCNLFPFIFCFDFYMPCVMKFYVFCEYTW